VVFGGGPAGLATAIAARRQGLSVIVVERSDYNSTRVGEHVAPDVKPALVALGLGDMLVSGRHAACPGIRSVWGSGQPLDRDYLFNPHGEGLNLSRPDFDRSLLQVAQQIDVTVISNARTTMLLRRDRSWHLRVKSAAKSADISCKVVVDATGRNAVIAKQLGARPVVYDELIGMFGRVSPRPPRNNLVLIESLHDGWWYSAGLADGTVIGTFFTDPELIDTSRDRRAGLWRTLLDQAHLTAARVSSDEAVDLEVRTARTQRLDQVVGDGWLAVGDAAMSFDPLSSQGISKAIEWGERAGAVVAAQCQGDHRAGLTYSEEVARSFADYLVTRYRYYASERRWPTAPFWRKRIEPPKPVSGAL